MLKNIPASVNFSTRQVVLRHPNSMECTVWRKEVKRVELDPATGLPSTMGGSPTLGGMGVLRSEDEAEYTYRELGAARMLFAGAFQPNDLVERDDAMLQQNLQEAQLASVADASKPEHFEADTGDLILLDMGLGVVLAYEVATITGNIAIPPYTRKLMLNPRDDLHALEPFTQ